MAFSLSTRPRGYDALFDAMIASVPPGTFYDLAYPIVQWTSQPNQLVLTTDNPGYAVNITRECFGDFDIGVDQGNRIDTVTVVPQEGQTSTFFEITLGRGRNRLTATEVLPGGGGRVCVFEVIATTTTVIFESEGREINASVEAAQEVQDAIFSPTSTRLLDQLSEIGEVLPDLQTLKTLSTKMLVRAFLHFPATTLGTKNLIQAITVNTPIMMSQRDGTLYEVETSRIMRTVENTAGQEAHIWFPNLAVTRWLAFLNMANNFTNNYQLKSVRDDYVTVVYKNRTNTHFFDYDAFGQNFLTNLSLNNCFANISVTSGILINSRIFVPCWTYPFDYVVTAQNLIGQTRTHFDSGIPFDSGVPFDADPVDPWTDGWLGWSLSGRFDQGSSSGRTYPLDSMVQPALTWTGPATAYNGPYTQLLNSENAEVDLTYLVTASGESDVYTGGPITQLAVSYSQPDGTTVLEPPFTAGVPVLLCVKYADAMEMTNLSGAGIIAVTEPLTGDTEYAPVTAGFIYVGYTPTVATDATVFQLNDGTYTGTSRPFKVLPNVFYGIEIAAITNQSVGQPFTVTITAVDQYGNRMSDPPDTLVHIDSTGGFDQADPVPRIANLVNGQAVLQLTMNHAGSGTLQVSLETFTAESNVFEVV